MGNVAGMAGQLLLIAALVAVNAAFAGTELALLSLREPQLERLERRSRTGAVLARLAREPNRFLATIQIVLTLAGFFASATAALTFATVLEGRLGFLGGSATVVSVVVVTLLLAYVTLVFGELAPKRLGMQRAERWALVMARPLDLLSRVNQPIVWLLSRSTDAIVRLLGGDPTRQREEITPEEIREMVALHGRFSPEELRIVDGAFEIVERTLGQIVVPRVDVFVVDADMVCADALAPLIESGHTRAPVAERRNLDRALGVVHLRQLVTDPEALAGSAATELPAFPEAAKVLTALRELQRRRLQMALVIDEHGGASGIVTVEDLVEELVGEIHDEADPELSTARREPDGSLVLPGRFPIHDLVDLDVTLPVGEYATVAGLVLDRIGRVPEVGERVEVEGWTIEVSAVVGHGITELTLHPRGN